MDFLAFASFAVLVIAWIAAPSKKIAEINEVKKAA